MEPSAVTSHDSREIAPTWAMFAGSMMIPEPIMLTATMQRQLHHVHLLGLRIAMSSVHRCGGSHPQRRSVWN